MSQIDRRRFIGNSATCLAGAAVVSGVVPVVAGQTGRSGGRENRPLFIATWPFGEVACQQAVRSATEGTGLDGIEKGIHVTEADATNASVGIGGIPNADGVVELDACIMSGPGHQAGSVAGINSILHPISVARVVMEKTPHVMLVGDNARKFATENGFTETQLLTDKRKEEWLKWKDENEKQGEGDENQVSFQVTEDHHDTIAMLGLDANGDLYGGCSTSGWGYKIPGRVGDSPIIGSGLYVDNTTGAAGATGLGENVMRYCGSFLVVEFMRNGASPVDACQMAIERINELDPLALDKLSINFIALNKQGEYGAAGTNQGFKYSWASPDGSGVLDARGLTAKNIGPEGGNRD